MIASITLLADVFHETARALGNGVRQRVRVVAARLLEDADNPLSLFPATGALDCALISLSIGDQPDALRLLVCRQPASAGSPPSATIADLMANAIAVQVIGWTNATVEFAALPAPRGGWPEVLAVAAHGINDREPGIGVVVVELGTGDMRYHVLACLLGNQHAGLAHWAPTTAIRGV